MQVNNTAMPRPIADWDVNIRDFLMAKPDVMLSGIPPLDKALGTLAGSFVVVPGPPAVGKSDLLINCSHGAVSSGVPVVYLSLELGQRPVMTRIISSIELSVMRSAASPTLNDESLKPCSNGPFFEQAIDVFEQSSARMFLLDGLCERGLTPRYVEDLHVIVMRICENFDSPCFIAIDYLQLLSSRDVKGSSIDVIDHVSRTLATIAHTTGSCVMAASSITKDGSIRGSNQVLFDSDVAISMANASEDAKGMRASAKQSIREINLHLVKNRNGDGEYSIALRYTPAWHHFE